MKILLLGSTGKMGTAITRVFSKRHNIIGKNSKDFDARDFKSVRKLIKENPTDIVINTVAMLGIDACEKCPNEAFVLNASYPKLLAELSNKHDFLLIHFSTDAVFDGAKHDYYVETDIPMLPFLNSYGETKASGDCFIRHEAKKYYIFRIPILFGRSSKDNQFVEKMLKLNKDIRVADNIITSPTYSIDIANMMNWLISFEFPYGLYHIANEGKVSLYELMKEIVRVKGLSIKVKPASYTDFPFIGKKNLYTPLKSCKIPQLRNWKEAVKECYGEQFDYR